MTITMPSRDPVLAVSGRRQERSVSNEEPETHEMIIFSDPAPKMGPQTGRPLPILLLRRYASVAAEMAEVKLLEDQSLFLEVPALPGVWAEGETLRDALTELREVIFEWAALKVQDQDGDIPVLDGLDLNKI